MYRPLELPLLAGFIELTQSSEPTALAPKPVAPAGAAIKIILAATNNAASPTKHLRRRIRRAPLGFKSRSTSADSRRRSNRCESHLSTRCGSHLRSRAYPAHRVRKPV